MANGYSCKQGMIDIGHYWPAFCIQPNCSNMFVRKKVHDAQIMISPSHDDPVFMIEFQDHTMSPTGVSQVSSFLSRWRPATWKTTWLFTLRRTVRFRPLLSILSLRSMMNHYKIRFWGVISHHKSHSADPPTLRTHWELATLPQKLQLFYGFI